MWQVVICFKFSNFAYANTVINAMNKSNFLLLFALNLVTLLMQIQYAIFTNHVPIVVICFKFSNFAYANTVNCKCSLESTELLFALNLVTLLMQIQYRDAQDDSNKCCYLL